jgi:hypothetical protein
LYRGNYYVSPRKAYDEDPAPEVGASACAHCGKPFLKYSYRSRYCSADCRTAFVVEERRKAIALWRAQG